LGVRIPPGAPAFDLVRNLNPANLARPTRPCGLADRLGGDEPLTQALLILLTVGLIWQFVLVLILLRRELGSLEWSRVRDALWLRPPRDPKTRRVGGRVWWWALLFVALVAVWGMVPGIPGPSARDFGEFLGSDVAQPSSPGRGAGSRSSSCLWSSTPCSARSYSSGGFLLPRMRAAFGRGDWVANGVLFTLYHLHRPWVMPATLVDGIFLEAYPTRRFQSAWMGIIVHSVRSVFVIAVVLVLVLK
jgi:uncharacterized protein